MYYLYINPKLEEKKYINELHSKFNFTSNFEDATKLLVIGGDGTLLHALRKFKKIKIPIYAINYGHKGILMLLPKYTDFLNLQIIKIKRLNSTYGLFMNEIVYGNNFGCLNEFSIYINDVIFKIIKCDNIIVASSCGSTGYSLSVGGPFIFDGIIISVSAGQSLFKTMVVPINYRVKIVGSEIYEAVIDGVDRYKAKSVEIFYDGDMLEFGSKYGEFETRKNQFDKVFNNKN